MDVYGCGSFRTTVNRPSEAGGSLCESAISRDRVWSRHERSSCMVRMSLLDPYVPWKTLPSYGFSL
jgi:hypothetical protein